MFVADKVDKIAKLTTKVNTGGSLPHLSKELILIPQMKQNYFKQIFTKTIFVCCCGRLCWRDSIGGDKREKIGNI